MIKKIYLKFIEPKHSKTNFLRIINHNGYLLDVGCGNNSPYKIKSKYPNIKYTGIDIIDYNQTKKNIADNYILTKSENFAETIFNLQESFDTVISSHNLEHCNDRDLTLSAMLKVLKPGGLLFLPFPSEESVNFPSLIKGTLNYYDDKTHNDLPPNFDKIITTLKTNNMKIIFSNKSYKPFFRYWIGAFQQLIFRKTKVKSIGTWAYWGFEAIIWAKKEF